MHHHTHTAVWLNSLIYMSGGHDGEYDPSYNINCYDPVNNWWRPPISTFYHNFSMTVLNKKLLIA